MFSIKPITKGYFSMDSSIVFLGIDYYKLDYETPPSNSMFNSIYTCSQNCTLTLTASCNQGSTVTYKLQLLFFYHSNHFYRQINWRSKLNREQSVQWWGKEVLTENNDKLT